MTDTSYILIVEADILVRYPLAEYLRECGYIVMEALDGQEARILLEKGDSQIDIVLADAGGEKSTGDCFALASWIRANHPDVQIILAGSISRATEKAGDLCEEGPVLSKPYDHQFVLENIRRLLGARSRYKRADVGR